MRTGVWRVAILCILAVVGLALILVWSEPETAIHKHKPQLHHLARQEAIKTAQNREASFKSDCRDPYCLMRERLPALKEFRILDQRPLAPMYSVILIQASTQDHTRWQPHTEEPKPSFINPDTERQLTGLFIINNRNQQVKLTLSLSESKLKLQDPVGGMREASCDDTNSVRLETVSSQQISTLKICTNRYSYGQTQHFRSIYFLETGFTQVRKSKHFESPKMESLFLFQGQFYLALNNAQLLRFSPDNPNKYELIGLHAKMEDVSLRSFFLAGPHLQLNDALLNGSSWQKKARPERTPVQWGPWRVPLPLSIASQKKLLPSPEKPELLVFQDEGWGFGFIGQTSLFDGIAVLKPKPVFYPLPQPTLKNFKTHRPSWHSGQNPLKLSARIGAFQLEGRKIWLGVSFYDGEGSSGIGRLGYFDLDRQRYVLDFVDADHAQAAFSDWSISALLADSEQIWLGLVNTPEGEPYSGGLAQYRIANGEVTKFRLRPVIKQIERSGDQIWLLTDEGLYCLKNKQWVYWGLSQNEAGREILYSRPVVLEEMP